MGPHALLTVGPDLLLYGTLLYGVIIEVTDEYLICVRYSMVVKAVHFSFSVVGVVFKEAVVSVDGLVVSVDGILVAVDGVGAS